MYNTNDTIAAISTPAGRSGIGVVRVSGLKSVSIANLIFQSSNKESLENIPSHTIHHGWIYSDKERVDEVMLALMRKPKSYTGEDVIEIFAHGNSLVLEHILKLLLANGARLAGPGEFTFRAFINGRMDLAKAESVAELINARTNAAARAALAQVNGKFSKLISAWRNDLVDILSLTEAALDHSEEDISFITPNESLERVTRLQKQIDSLINTASKSKVLKEGIRIAIVGKPNSGKSSILNALLNTERSIVTDIAGTTRDVIEDTIDIDGIPVVIMDTAGLRQHTLDLVEKIGHERAIECMKSSDFALWIIDSSLPISSEDRYIAELLSTSGLNNKVIAVLNKIDCPQATGMADVKQILKEPAQCSSVSALTGKGILELEKAIAQAASFSDAINEPVLTSVRQREALSNASQSITLATTAIKEKEMEEIVAQHLRQALGSLGEITGETATEEILENIFSKFCIGK